MDSTVEHLRLRASALRDMAARLDEAPVLSLGQAAGEDTWVGPAASEYLVQLGRYQNDVLQAAEDLRWQAWLLEERADQRAADLAQP